jgi:hypothetical protein
MIIASLKYQKMHKCLKKQTFSLLVHLESLDNKHMCMKVIDEKGEIY